MKKLLIRIFTKETERAPEEAYPIVILWPPLELQQ